MKRTVYFAIAGLAFAATVGSLSAADHYYVNDHLATTTAVTDAAGEIAAIEADAFGTPVAGATQAARYTGKPYDNDIGAYVFPCRNYRSDEARWMSTDPSGFPDGVNSCRYAPNANSQIDPLGLVTFNDIDIQYVDASQITKGYLGAYSYSYSGAGGKANATGSDSNGWTANASLGYLYTFSDKIELPNVGSTKRNSNGVVGAVNQSFQNDVLTHELWHEQITRGFYGDAYGAFESWSASYSSNLFSTKSQAENAYTRDMTSALALIKSKNFADDSEIGHPGAFVSNGVWTTNKADWGLDAYNKVGGYTYAFTKMAGNFHKE